MTAPNTGFQQAAGRAMVEASHRAKVARAPTSEGVALANCLASAGWEVAHIDLDLTGDRPKAEINLERSDGRWLLARVDRLGRANYETFQRDRHLGMSPNTRGRRPLSPQVDDHFLGRHRCLDARHLLKDVALYVAHNATAPVRLEELQAAWAAVLGAPLRLSEPEASPG